MRILDLSSEHSVHATACLSRVCLFAWLDAEKLAFLVERAELDMFEEGEVLSETGSPGMSLTVIGQGVVDVIRPEVQRVVARLFAGDFFGEMCLIQPKSRVATCRAETPVQAFTIHQRTFEEFAGLYPDQHGVLISNVARYYSKALREVNHRVTTTPQTISGEAA